MSKAPPAKLSAAEKQQAQQAARLKSATALAAQASAFASNLPQPAVPASSSASASSSSASSTAAASRSSRRSGASSSSAATSSSGPNGSGGGVLLPPGLLSKEDSKLFSTRFRAAQKSPQLVGLQIRALDGLVASLKQKRSTASRVIAEALAEIATIENEEAATRQRSDPLAARIEANERRRTEMLRTKAQADLHMESIVAEAGVQVGRVQHAVDAFKQRQLKLEMEAERGRHMRTTPQQAARAHS